MWKDNLVFYKSKSYLIFCTSIGVYKTLLLVNKQIPITEYILSVRTSLAHQWVRVVYD